MKPNHVILWKFLVQREITYCVGPHHTPHRLWSQKGHTLCHSGMSLMGLQIFQVNCSKVFVCFHLCTSIRKVTHCAIVAWVWWDYRSFKLIVAKYLYAFICVPVYHILVTDVKCYKCSNGKIFQFVTRGIQLQHLAFPGTSSCQILYFSRY